MKTFTSKQKHEFERVLNEYVEKDIRWELTYDEVKDIAEKLGLVKLHVQYNDFCTCSNADSYESWGPCDRDRKETLIYTEFDCQPSFGKENPNWLGRETTPGAVHHFNVRFERLIELGYLFEKFEKPYRVDTGYFVCENVKNALNCQYNQTIHYRRENRHKGVAIRGCELTKCVFIPERIIKRKVTTIHQQAFYGREDIEYVFLPDTIVEIGDRAFWGCKNLKAVYLPKSLRTISLLAFEGCEKLHARGFPIENRTSHSYSHYRNSAIFEVDGLQFRHVNGGIAITSCKNVEYCKIPKRIAGKEVIAIEVGAFKNCTALRSLYIPATVVKLNDYEHFELEFKLFERCNNLEEVVVSRNNKHYCSTGGVLFSKQDDKLTLLHYPHGLKTKAYRVPENVTEIGEFAFAHNTLIEVVSIPDCCEVVNCSAFEGCTALQEVTLPNKLSAVKGGTFNGCSRLDYIAIPASVSVIGAKAFYGCDNLEVVEFAEGSILEEVGDFAFYNCPKLKYVSLPKSVRLIGDCAFGRCDHEWQKGMSVPVPEFVLSGCAGGGAAEYACEYACVFDRLDRSSAGK